MDCRFADRTVASMCRRSDLEFIAEGRNFIVEALAALAAGRPVASTTYYRVQTLLAGATAGAWVVSWQTPNHERAQIRAKVRVQTGDDAFENKFTLIGEFFRRDGETIAPEVELIAALPVDVAFLLGLLEPLQTVEVDGFVVDWEDADDARRHGPWEPCPVNARRGWNERTGARLDRLLLPSDPTRTWIEYIDRDTRNCRRSNLRVRHDLEALTLRVTPQAKRDIEVAVKDGDYSSLEELVLEKCL
ncbi:hypothetical protein [Azospirillum sp. sgz301742]